MKHAKTVLILSFVLLVFATSAFASSGGEEASPWTPWMLLWRVVNTVALIGVLVYFLKKPLITFFSERTAQIQKDLDDAKEQRDKAERLIAEYQHKLAGMEKELEKMRVELRKTADAESGKVLANAEKVAAAMIESAKLTAEQEVRKAKEALKNEAVILAVEMAETLVQEKIDSDDRKRIVEDYLVKVGGMKQ
ncbi:MAG TPA: ATP synthase F0 subunit B [Desulfomonilaceae bacterium]|nr:ATP synthase F0 subunit B [Desulfomonilaceae bacterium]